MTGKHCREVMPTALDWPSLASDGKTPGRRRNGPARGIFADQIDAVRVAVRAADDVMRRIRDMDGGRS